MNDIVINNESKSNKFMTENVKSTYKSNDTEEWLDTVWTRPIGYQWALFFKRLDIHPQ